MTPTNHISNAVVETRLRCVVCDTCPLGFPKRRAGTRPKLKPEGGHLPCAKFAGQWLMAVARIWWRNKSPSEKCPAWQGTKPMKQIYFDQGTAGFDQDIAAWHSERSRLPTRRLALRREGSAEWDLVTVTAVSSGPCPHSWGSHLNNDCRSKTFVFPTFDSVCSLISSVLRTRTWGKRASYCIACVIVSVTAIVITVITTNPSPSSFLFTNTRHPGIVSHSPCVIIANHYHHLFWIVFSSLPFLFWNILFCYACSVGGSALPVILATLSVGRWFCRNSFYIIF